MALLYWKSERPGDTSPGEACLLQRFLNGASVRSGIEAPALCFFSRGSLRFNPALCRVLFVCCCGNPWLAEVMRDLSGLGSTIVLTLFTLATVGYRARQGLDKRVVRLERRGIT